MSIAAVALIAGLVNLIGRYSTLSMFGILLYSTLSLGGFATVGGRVRDVLATESAGIALLIGGFSFSMLRSLARAVDAAGVTGAILSVGALVIGLAIRLHVVRKALGARIRAAKLLEGRSG